MCLFEKNIFSLILYLFDLSFPHDQLFLQLADLLPAVAHLSPLYRLPRLQQALIVLQHPDASLQPLVLLPHQLHERILQSVLLSRLPSE